MLATVLRARAMSDAAASVEDVLAQELALHPDVVDELARAHTSSSGGRCWRCADRAWPPPDYPCAPARVAGRARTYLAGVAELDTAPIPIVAS